MRYKVEKCDVVGNAYMVVRISRFAKKIMARGLTEFEAKCYAIKLNNK